MNLKSITPLFCLFCVSLTLAPLALNADSFEFSEIGFRVGFDGDGGVELNSYEAVAYVESPWSFDLGESVEIDIEFELGLGALSGEDETGLLAHLGPALEIELDDFPIEFVVSSGPALLAEYEFDQLDLGGSFQFMTSAGLDLELFEDWTFGYRFQHISNAHIHDSNPGLDLHAVSVLYEF